MYVIRRDLRVLLPTGWHLRVDHFSVRSCRQLPLLQGRSAWIVSQIAQSGPGPGSAGETSTGCPRTARKAAGPRIATTKPSDPWVRRGPALCFNIFGRLCSKRGSLLAGSPLGSVGDHGLFIPSLKVPAREQNPRTCKLAMSVESLKFIS